MQRGTRRPRQVLKPVSQCGPITPSHSSQSPHCRLNQPQLLQRFSPPPSSLLWYAKSSQARFSTGPARHLRHMRISVLPYGLPCPPFRRKNSVVAASACASARSRAATRSASSLSASRRNRSCSRCRASASSRAIRSRSCRRASALRAASSAWPSACAASAMS